MKKCHECGAPWDGSPGTQPGRSEACAGCGKDLHSCLNCGLFSFSAPNQCTSRTSEPVKDKEKGNYCDEFEFDRDRGGETGRSGDMESKWNDLFK